MIDDLPICEVADPDLDRPAPRFQNDEPAGESDRPIDPDLHEPAAREADLGRGGHV